MISELTFTFRGSPGADTPTGGFTSSSITATLSCRRKISIKQWLLNVISCSGSGSAENLFRLVQLANTCPLNTQSSSSSPSAIKAKIQDIWKRCSQESFDPHLQTDAREVLSSWEASRSTPSSTKKRRADETSSTITTASLHERDSCIDFLEKSQKQDDNNNNNARCDSPPLLNFSQHVVDPSLYISPIKEKKIKMDEIT